MPLPNEDPSNPALPAPLFADVDAVRGDQLRANNQLIWENLQYLFDFTGRTTDTLTEGATNLYYTDVRAKAAALAAALTGFVAGSDAAIAATDTILQAFAKTQGQINGLNSRFFTQPAVQATTSGTEKDFLNIPAAVKKITIMFDGVSTNGSNHLLVQIGDAGGIESAGYYGAVQRGAAFTALNTGFEIDQAGNAGELVSGAMVLTLLDASTNTWTCSAVVGFSTASIFTSQTGGAKSLSAALDRVRLTTIGGTDAFDAGKVSCIYE